MKPARKQKNKTILAVVADRCGEIFELPDAGLVGANGAYPLLPSPDEMIPMPEGSRLFVIPGADPLIYDYRKRETVAISSLPRSLGGGKVQPVSAFLTPGYTRTLLPAVRYHNNRQQLPLWSYTAVGWCVEEERFYVAATQVDINPQWQPEHYDDRVLDPLVQERLNASPDNRLLEQLSRCALDYHCFAAKNLFFGRWEAPLPISPTCNSRCLGCISLQEAPECCPSSQERLTFVPTVEELTEVAVPHLKHAENAIVSFGQGCEGDPILQADQAAKAVRAMREATSRGTINFNSNASLPDKVSLLADAGINSIRVSLNSVREEVYNAYYRPKGYRFTDVKMSIKRAKDAGLFTMLNYLVFPGVNDQEGEVEALLELVDTTGIDLIQMRNLSIDPDFYWQSINFPQPGIGFYRMMQRLKEEIPRLQFGYFNRTKENFFPEGFEKGWPIG